MQSIIIIKHFDQNPIKLYAIMSQNHAKEIQKSSYLLGLQSPFSLFTFLLFPISEKTTLAIGNNLSTFLPQ